MPTPSIADGAQISFTDMLKACVQEFVNLHDKVDWSKEKIQIKIFGDRARMTRNSSFILLSFSLLQNQDDVMSASGNRTFAIVKGSESYETLKDSSGMIFQEINSLIQVSAITVNTSRLNLESFLGGRPQISTPYVRHEISNIKFCMCSVQNPQGKLVGNGQKLRIL